MGFFDSVSSFFKDVVNVVMTPFKEVFKAITGTVSDAAQHNIEAIEGAVGLDPSDVGNLAKGVVDAGGDLLHGVADAGSGILKTGENIVNRGADTVFGMADVMKYVPIALLGLGGFFIVNNADKILDIGDKRINR